MPERPCRERSYLLSSFLGSCWVTDLDNVGACRRRDGRGPTSRLFVVRVLGSSSLTMAIATSLQKVIEFVEAA